MNGEPTVFQQRPGLAMAIYGIAGEEAMTLMRSGRIPRREVSGYTQRRAGELRPLIIEAFSSDPRRGARILYSHIPGCTDAMGETNAEGLRRAVQAEVITEQEAREWARSRADEQELARSFEMPRPMARPSLWTWLKFRLRTR